MINMSVDDHQDDPYYNPSPIAPPSNFSIFRWVILCLGAVFVLLIVAVVMIALQRPLGFWLVGIAFVLAVAGLFVYMQAIKAKQQLAMQQAGLSGTAAMGTPNDVAYQQPPGDPSPQSL